MSRPGTYILFALAVVVQLVVLAAVPARRVFASYAGTTVVLKIEPVDPYSILSGYYMDLQYEIGRAGTIEGWDSLPARGRVYVVLVEGDDGIWHAASIHGEKPTGLPPGAVVIEGFKEYRDRVRYGIESFYVPEDTRRQIESDLQEHTDQASAEVAVGPFGIAALLRLRVQDRVYEY